VDLKSARRLARVDARPHQRVVRPHRWPHLFEGFGFRVSGFGFRVWSLGFGVLGFGFWVLGLGFKV